MSDCKIKRITKSIVSKVLSEMKGEYIEIYKKISNIQLKPNMFKLPLFNMFRMFGGINYSDNYVYSTIVGGFNKSAYVNSTKKDILNFIEEFCREEKYEHHKLNQTTSLNKFVLFKCMLESKFIINYCECDEAVEKLYADIEPKAIELLSQSEIDNNIVIKLHFIRRILVNCSMDDSETYKFIYNRWFSEETFKIDDSVDLNEIIVKSYLDIKGDEYGTEVPSKTTGHIIIKDNDNVHEFTFGGTSSYKKRYRSFNFLNES